MEHHFNPPDPSPGMGIVPAERGWYGKRPPSYCQPLTLEWFQAAVTPRGYDEASGVPLRALTPPKRGPFPWAGLALLILLLGLGAVWASHVFKT